MEKLIITIATEEVTRPKNSGGRALLSYNLDMTSSFARLPSKEEKNVEFFWRYQPSRRQFFFTNCETRCETMKARGSDKRRKRGDDNAREVK